jgi:hypothetical protein
MVYYVALPFIHVEDGLAPGEAVECPNGNAAVRRAQAMASNELMPARCSTFLRLFRNQDRAEVRPRVPSWRQPVRLPPVKHIVIRKPQIWKSPASRVFFECLRK